MFISGSLEYMNVYTRCVCVWLWLRHPPSDYMRYPLYGTIISHSLSFSFLSTTEFIFRSNWSLESKHFTVSPIGFRAEQAVIRQWPHKPVSLPPKREVDKYNSIILNFSFTTIMVCVDRSRWYYISHAQMWFTVCKRKTDWWTWRTLSMNHQRWPTWSLKSKQQVAHVVWYCLMDHLALLRIPDVTEGVLNWISITLLHKKPFGFQSPQLHSYFVNTQAPAWVTFRWLSVTLTLQSE